MSNKWDFYLLRVDDKPASIFVDLGIKDNAPIARFTHMAYVRVYMIEPRDDGLSSQAEFDTLIALEDRVTKELTAKGMSVYVGRNTSNGCRDLYFYTCVPDRWDLEVTQAMSAFPQYTCDSGVRPDAEWETYFRFLYPSARDLRSITNRGTCDALKRNGDSLTTPREIDHWAYFPDPQGRTTFIAAALALGFSVRVAEVDSDASGYGVKLFRVDTPGRDEIDRVTEPLFEAAKQAGGAYDGWESPVVRE